jgi:hypothetical protein
MKKLDYNLAWKYLNEVCFGEEMAPPKILCYHATIWGSDAHDEVLAGTYHIPSSEIMVHVGQYVDWNDGGALETLYHEMVHQYINEVLDASKENPDHGALFNEVYESGLVKLNLKKDVIKAMASKKGGSAGAKMKSGGSKKTHGAGQAGVGPPGISGSGPKQSKGKKQSR